MKKTLKILLLITVIVLTACTFAIAGYADGEELPFYSIYDKDGNLTDFSGDSTLSLSEIANSLPDGCTIVLNQNMLATNGLYFESPEDAPRNINFDLNGYVLYSVTKIEPAVFTTGSYTTLNVYSSREDGCIYLCNRTNPSLSGNVFSVRGKSSVINVGDFTGGDNFYPGSNMSTCSAALVDVVVTVEECDAGCRFNVNGGSYYSIHDDYSGYIIPRGGEVVMNISNANIINIESKSPINSVGPNTVLNLNKCVIVQYQATSQKMFNNAIGTVNMTDCVTSYTLNASSGTGTGNVHLIGKNVFAGEEYDLSLVDGGQSLVPATTYAEYELADGITEFEYYDNSLSFKPVKCSAPTLLQPTTLVLPEDTVKYQFVKGKTKITQSWMKSEIPTPPFELPFGGEEGVYKYGWIKETDDSGVIVCTVEYVPDYALKVRAVYEDDELYFKLYAPAEIVDGGYIDYINVSIQGNSYPKEYWGEEVVDGVRYCCAMTEIIDPENKDEIITVEIPCDYKKDVHVNGRWSFTLEDYINEVLKSEDEGIYSEEQYEIIHEIRDLYFPEAE